MAIRDIFKVSRKTFLYPSAWIDLDNIRYQNRTIWTILKGLFITPLPEREENFEQAMVRLGLTEADVKSGAKTYRYYATIFLLLGIFIFVYAFYLLFSHVTFAGWFLGLAVSVLCFSQAFKYDFWSFQMRRRKLGATFAEWKQSILGGKEMSS